MSGAQKRSLDRDNYIGGLYNGDEDANESFWQYMRLCRWYMLKNDLKPVYKKNNITKLIANKTAESWKENEKYMISRKLREIMFQEKKLSLALASVIIPHKSNRERTSIPL